MKTLSANEIRKKFLDFFESAPRNHKIVPRDSVVPKDDPTVLFTTAGMQQFKPNFLGIDKSLKRAASSQKCLRTDDLDKIGKTAFHHTFFEMLGNFSFGDYFKKEAITWAWEFLTKELHIPAEKLWVSVYKDDTEAYNHWLNDIKVPKNKIVKLGDKDNFWPAEAKQKGPNGPCGPCSEIFFDYGVNPDCPKRDKCDLTCNCGRFTEIWNLVFTQFNRKDGGVLEPLPGKNIDTGMGLERLVAVMQGKRTSYETDLFEPILKAIDKEINKDIESKEKKIIADHIRAIVFAIADGIIPSNKERGSVVKRLINDSTNIALSKDAKGPSIHKLVPTVVEVMKAQYPELEGKTKDIQMYIKSGEESFILVLKQRIPVLKEKLSERDLTPQERGEIYFINRDTFGLPVPVIFHTDATVGTPVQERVAAMDHFYKLLEQRKELSRAGSKMTGDVFANKLLNLALVGTTPTDFIGYDKMKNEKAKILKLFRKETTGEEQIYAFEGDEVNIVLDKTPFYAESGGQIGDSGYLTCLFNEKKTTVRILDTQKQDNIYIHIGRVESGKLTQGPNVTFTAQVDEERRLSIMRNHTATHLLQAALRRILGNHVQQQGSLVAEDRLRFDFTHPQAIGKEQISEIENMVNGWVTAKDKVDTKEMTLEEAKKSGALAFFAEKYGQKVRVVSIGSYSKEFCGGTHVKETGQIEKIKITGEGSVAQGIRRLEAKTGKKALEFIDQQAKEDQAKLEALKLKEAEAKAQKSQFTEIMQELKDRIGKIENKKDSQVVTYIIHQDNVSVENLRSAADYIKQNLESAAVLIGSKSGYVLATVTDDLIKHNIKANDIIERIKPMIDGNGGGRPQMAQAGTKDPSKIEGAIKKIKDDLEKQIRNGR